MEVMYTIKLTMQTAALSLLTTTSITDISLSTLHDHGTTKCHHTSVNCRSKVCVNKRLLSQ